MSLLVLGDCHAVWARLIAAIDCGHAQHGATAVIQVGDFGFFPIYIPLLIEALAGRRFPVPVHVIDGNHEDHAWLWGQAAAGVWERWAADLNLVVHRRGDTVGADFIQMPIGLLGKVVNAFVFVAIEHDTRRVHLLGITIHPTDVWIAQCLRNATMEGEPLSTRKHWILDNDSKYGVRTHAVLGKKLLHTALYTPDMNAYCERFVRSISEECLDHIVFLSEEHLRDYVVGYLEHYNRSRPHQGIGNMPIGPWEVGTGEIVCDESLHGSLKSFRRAA